MKCLAYLAASVDGYIATPGDGLEWLDHMPAPPGTDFGYERFVDSVDVLVMGRNTFDTVVGMEQWPYELPVVVMSRSEFRRPEIVGDSDVEVSTLSPTELVAELSDAGRQAAYVDGGALITSFLADGLLDELIVTQVPVVLGDGIPLFGKLDQPVWLDLVGVERYGSFASADRAAGDAVLQYHYRVRRDR